MCFIIEQAGGGGSTGRQCILDVKPEGLHQRVPVIPGFCDEVKRVVHYCREHDGGDDRRVA